MKLKNIYSAKFIYSIFFLLLTFLLVQVFGSNSNIPHESKPEIIIFGKSLWDYNEPSVEEREQLDKEILQIQELTLKQRSELILTLKDTISDPNKKLFSHAVVCCAIDILGQIRAIEASDILLNMLDYELFFDKYSMPSSDDPFQRARKFHTVNSLIKIRPPYSIILKKIVDEDSFIRQSCYIAVLIDTEGVDVSRFVIEKAIEKESDERKLIRLNAALDLINERFPVIEEIEN